MSKTLAVAAKNKEVKVTTDVKKTEVPSKRSKKAAADKQPASKVKAALEKVVKSTVAKKAAKAS